MAANEKYLNKGQALLIETVKVLAGRPLQTHSVQALCGALAEPRDSVFRTLKTLEHAGWARRHDDGHWMVAPGLTHISERYRLALAQAHMAYLAVDTSHA